MRIVVWWLSVVALGYPLVVYPAVLAIWARGRRRESPRLCAWPAPALSIIIPAHNEAACIGAKIRNTLALAYPPDRREILVVCDGCTDETAATARAAADPTVQILELPRRVGKAEALNQAVALASGEVVVATDAGGMLPQDALAHLIPHFRDPDVGCVCGPYTGAQGGARCNSAYYRLDMAMRMREADIRTTLSGTGGLMAFRTESFTPLPPQTIHDDFVLPARLAIAGLRVLYEPRAPVQDPKPPSLTQWYRQRVRTVYGNWQLLALMPRLLNPMAGYLAWVFLSHKAGRHLAPLAAAAAWASSTALHPIAFPLLTALAAAAAAAGALGCLTATRDAHPPGPLTFGLLYALAWGHATTAWILRRPVPWS